MPEPSGENPTVAGRRLLARLRRMRDERGHGLSDVAATLGVSAVQASRLETGARPLKDDQIRSLGKWYEISASELGVLLDLAAESRTHTWWTRASINPGYSTLIGLESAALEISEYCGSVIPGLAQTREYALAAVAASSVEVDQKGIDAAVDTRMRRQKVLVGPTPPRVWMVLDEAILARTTGGRRVMLRQLEHLVNLSKRPTVTLQVVGFEYGIHPGGYNHFILLHLDEDVPDVVYEEDVRVRIFDVENHSEARRYRRIWNILQAISLDPTNSRRRVESYMARLNSGKK